MRETFSAFNGLRILAAFCVISLHYGTSTQGFSALPYFVQNIARNGAIALPFFFVLSGFVLTHAYVDRISSLQSARQFYLARFARLYPVYLFSFLLFLPIAVEKYLLNPAVTEQHGARTFILGGTLTLFVLQAWTPLSQAWNGPGWSLSVEAMFYLLFPLILPRMLRIRRLPLIVGISALWLFMMTVTMIHEHNVISSKFWHNYVGYQPLFWTPLFLLGMATYRFKTLWSTLPDRLLTLIPAGLLAILVTLCALPPNMGGNLLVNGGSAPLLALTVLAFTHPRCTLSRFLGGRALTQLGGASYVVYILQAPVWHIFRRITDHLHHVHEGDKTADWQFMLYLPLLVGVSLAVQRLVERPAQGWLIKRNQLTTTEPATQERYVVGIEVGVLK